MESQFKEDYYKTLNVKNTATKDEIKVAFKKLALKYHPDKKGGSEEKMKTINEAYTILSSEEAKTEYDIWYKAKFYPQQETSKNNETKKEYKIYDEQEKYEFVEDYINKGKPKRNNDKVNNVELSPEMVDKIKKGNKSKNVYDVIVNTNPVVVPSFCTCCLDISKDEFNTACTKYFMDREYTLSFNFPICPKCKENMLEFQLKKILLIAGSMVVSLILITSLLFLPIEINFFAYMISTIAVTILSIYALHFLLKVKPLTDMQSSRQESVQIISFGEKYIRFRFQNYMYAKVFADMNNTQLKTIFKPTKISRSTSLLRGWVGIQIFVYVTFIVMFFAYFLYNFYMN